MAEYNPFNLSPEMQGRLKESRDTRREKTEVALRAADHYEGMVDEVKEEVEQVQDQVVEGPELWAETNLPDWYGDHRFWKKLKSAIRDYVGGFERDRSVLTQRFIDQQDQAVVDQAITSAEHILHQRPELKQLYQSTDVVGEERVAEPEIVNEKNDSSAAASQEDIEVESGSRVQQSLTAEDPLMDIPTTGVEEVSEETGLVRGIGVREKSQPSSDFFELPSTIEKASLEDSEDFWVFVNSLAEEYPERSVSELADRVYMLHPEIQQDELREEVTTVAKYLQVKDALENISLSDVSEYERILEHQVNGGGWKLAAPLVRYAMLHHCQLSPEVKRVLEADGVETPVHLQY